MRERRPSQTMKRHGRLWQRITDIENLHEAYRRARKGKSWQNTVKRFESHLDQNLLRIQQSLMTKSFRTSPYTEKIIHEPKTRTIYRLPFDPDRVVQHALMNVIEPIWSALFIDDSYACIIGKGIHAGSRRTMEFIRKNRFCLKMDISKFYPSVDHDILFDIVKRKIKCADTLWLIRNIIYSFPGGKNVPIGNYTSQWFGNLYLNELDTFIKQQEGVRHYVRYCDDFCLFSNDKARLSDLAHKIRNFLASRLKLALSKCDLFPVSRGVDFLGYRHFPKYILIRKSTVKRVKKWLAALPALYRSGEIPRERMMSSIASTVGWLRWANSYNLSRALGINDLMRLCRNGTTEAIQ